MRFLFLLVVVLNVGLFAYGRGYFGVPPSETGQVPAQRSELNAQSVTLGTPVLNSSEGQ